MKERPVRKSVAKKLSPNKNKKLIIQIEQSQLLESDHDQNLGSVALSEEKEADDQLNEFYQQDLRKLQKKICLVNTLCSQFVHSKSDKLRRKRSKQMRGLIGDLNKPVAKFFKTFDTAELIDTWSDLHDITVRTNMDEDSGHELESTQKR